MAMCTPSRFPTVNSSGSSAPAGRSRRRRLSPTTSSTLARSTIICTRSRHSRAPREAGVPNLFEWLFSKKEKKDQVPPVEVRDPDATVPLPQLPRAAPPDAQAAHMAEHPRRMTLGVAQDVGKVRGHNEDVLLVFTGELGGLEAMPNLGLFIVADGMGGHSLGERASGIAARTVARAILEQILPSLIADPHADTERPLLKDVMESAMTTANAAVVSGVPEGGATLTCALVLGEQLILSHVGDSRAYIITDETFEQVTRDP